MPLKNRLAVISRECVACGSCIKTCPLQAISVYRGIFAHVDASKCIGCGKCQKACPACVVTIIEKEKD